VEKELHDDIPIVMSAGTVVTRGRGSGIVPRTGPDSALGRIAALLSAQRPRPTSLQRRLGSLSRTLTNTARPASRPRWSRSPPAPGSSGPADRGRR
jgi:magnesium-transporting ATPase (P-type)